MLSGNGHDPARVDDGRPDPLRREPLRDLQAEFRHRPDGHDEHVAVRRLAQHVDAVGGAPLGVVLGADAALREAQHRRAVLDGDGLAELLAQPRRVARRGEADARDDLQDREIPHAVVARPVRSR